MMIPARLTNIEELNNQNAIHAFTTGIEGLHLEMDHNELLYSSEFLGSLNSAIKILLESDREDIRRSIKHLWTNKINKMLKMKTIKDNLGEKTIIKQ